MCGVIWRAAPAKFKTGMCEMKILGSEVLWRVFGTLVQDGLAHMRGVICSELFRQSSKTGMCEMKMFGSEVCSVFWDVGSGWVGSHVWCNMESCSGKVQKRYVWDENLGV